MSRSRRKCKVGYGERMEKFVASLRSVCACASACTREAMSSSILPDSDGSSFARCHRSHREIRVSYCLPRKPWRTMQTHMQHSDWPYNWQAPVVGTRVALIISRRPLAVGRVHGTGMEQNHLQRRLKACVHYSSLNIPRNTHLHEFHRALLYRYCVARRIDGNAQVDVTRSDQLTKSR